MRAHWARRQAEELVHRLQSKLPSAPPIDPVKVANALGLAVISDDLGPDVCGLLIRRADQVLIAVDRNDPPNRRNFTIAHEIGHHVLGHQFQLGEHVHVDRGHYISQRGPHSSQGIDPKEIEANQFAAALLMPSWLIREAVDAFGRPVLDSHVRELSKKFRVSDQAMTIRLTTLKYL